MTGTVIAAVIISLYLGWYLCVHGIPASISQTVYKLPHESIFTLVIYAVGFLTIMQMIDKCHNNTECLAFITITGMLFVGAAPLGKNCNEKVHIGGALFFGASSQLMVILNSPVLLLIWVPVAVLMLVTRGKNYLFWLELACIIDLLIFCLW